MRQEGTSAWELKGSYKQTEPGKAISLLLSEWSVKKETINR